MLPAIFVNDEKISYIYIGARGNKLLKMHVKIGCANYIKTRSSWPGGP